MLTRILSGDTLPLQLVEWPAVESNFGKDAVMNSFVAESRGPSLEVSQLRSEIAALQAEVRRSRAETDQRAQEAFAVGRREGELAVRQAFEQQWDEELAKLRQMMLEASAAGPKLRRQAEEDLVRLAVAVARRILHRELTIDTDALAGVVKAAFERLDQREVQQIRTDGASAPVVKKIAEQLGTLKPVKVVSDGRLRRGTLVIETQRGQLDASVETQLQEIERGFIDIVRQS
ncbi:MAG TPA: FliH/SctL family protein [Bryobacteraceae bacterium]|nr:FliH/SctL family protein [Bryobacteraceae bacterium]